MAISKISFTKTPQAGDDCYYWDEDALQLDPSVYNATTGYLTLDVMSNDLGGAAKTLYSIDDGSGNPLNPTDLLLADALVNGVSAWQETASGNLARINNGKIEFDLSNELPGGVNSLGADEQFTDTFVYAIRLGNGTLSWAHVHITIDGVNDSATITADNKDTTVVEDGGVANGTLGDPDASGQLTVHDLDAGEDKFLIPASLEGTCGTFTFDETGAWTYTLDQSKADALFDGEAASDTLKVTSYDGTASYEIKVDITGSNDAPVATDDTASATEDGAVVNGSVKTNDKDVDAGAVLTYSLDTSVAGLALNAGGTYSFDPSNVAYQHLAAGAFENVVASYTVTDDKGATDTATLTIKVTGVNDAPVAIDDTASATEDGTVVNGNVKTNDSDVDDGATLTYSLDAPVAGLTLNAGGTFSFDPSNVAYQHLAAGAFENVVASYTVTDDKSATDAGTLTITVTGVNDTPVAADDTASATEDGPVVNGSVKTNDKDVDDGAVLTYALDAPVAGLALNADGSYSFDPTNAAYQHLAAGAFENVVASYTVTDDKGATDTATLTITVTGINDAPVLDASKMPVGAAVLEDAGAPVGAVGTLVSSLVDLPAGGGLDNASDVDAGAVTGIAITAADTTNGAWYYSTDGGTTWLALGAVSDLSALLLTPSARLYFQPNANYDGEAAITFRAWDQTSGINGAAADTTSNGGTTAFSLVTDTATFDVTPVADNLPPTDIVLAVISPNGNSLPNSAFATLSAIDPDIGDTFVFSLAAGSSDGFSISGNTLSATSALADDTTHVLKIDVQDQGGTGNIYQETFNIITGSNAGNNPFPSSGDTNPILTGDDVLYGQGGIDFIYGGSGHDSLFGQGDDDQLFGGAGGDKLDGGAGNDKATGGEGNDTISVADGDDTVYFASAFDGTDLITGFDGKSNGGQDFINLDALFDDLGFSDADRAPDEGFKVVGNDLWIDFDNNDGTGANGGFEYKIATVTVADGTFDNADIIAGTA